MGIAALVPAWPWVALAPGNFLDAIAYLGQFPYAADTIFAGQRVPAPGVPLAYWPTLLALQLTEVMLVGLGLAALTLPWRASAGTAAMRGSWASYHRRSRRCCR